MPLELTPTYDDPERESVLRLGISGQPLVLVSNTAHVEIELVNDFDKQRHKHQNFGRKKFLGISFAKIEVTFVLMPDEEKGFFRDVLPLLRQRGKQGNSPALEVVNYQMNRAGVNKVNVLRSKIGPPSSKSGRAIHLQLEEWSLQPADPKPSDAASEKFDPSPGGIVDKRLSISKNT